MLNKQISFDVFNVAATPECDSVTRTERQAGEAGRGTDPEEVWMEDLKGSWGYTMVAVSLKAPSGSPGAPRIAGNEMDAAEAVGVLQSVRTVPGRFVWVSRTQGGSEVRQTEPLQFIWFTASLTNLSQKFNLHHAEETFSPFSNRFITFLLYLQQSMGHFWVAYYCH